MGRRHPLPRTWLMTDERMGDGLVRALRRLPRGSGVIFRHYATPPAERRRLFAAVRRVARARGLLLLCAGEIAGSGADGVHGRSRRRPGLLTWPAHNRREAVAGVRREVDALIVSPVFATQSHPAADALGPTRALRIVRGLKRPVIALGGMTRQRFQTLRQRRFHGWAAIDAWADQKRKAVPI